MAYHEGIVLLESIVPLTIGIALGLLALLGFCEFWNEFAVAFKGGF